MDFQYCKNKYTGAQLGVRYPYIVLIISLFLRGTLLFTVNLSLMLFEWKTSSWA